jgi:hypothetical protein
MNTINIFQAIERSEHKHKNYIISLLYEYFTKTQIFYKSLITIRYLITLSFNNKDIDLAILIHLTKNYPDTQAQFYLEKINGVGISPYTKYLQNGFRIVSPLMHTKHHIMEIITDIFLSFNSVFPIYRLSPYEQAMPFARECVIDNSYMRVTFEEDTKVVRNKQDNVKDILIKEMLLSLSNRLKSEMYFLKGQKTRLNNYKQYFSNRLDKLNNVINNRDETLKSMNIWMTNMQDQIYKLKQYNRSRVFTPFKLEKLCDCVYISDKRLIRGIAHIAYVEDLMFVFKKAFEVGIISFDNAIRNIRFYSQYLFKLKFCITN